MDYFEIQKIVEQHGGEVLPQEKNPRLDHIWHLQKENVSLCGHADGGPDTSKNPAGKLCANCMRGFHKLAKRLHIEKDSDREMCAICRRIAHPLRVYTPVDGRKAPLGQLIRVCMFELDDDRFRLDDTCTSLAESMGYEFRRDLTPRR